MSAETEIRAGLRVLYRHLVYGNLGSIGPAMRTVNEQEPGAVWDAISKLYVAAVTDRFDGPPNPAQANSLTNDVWAHYLAGATHMPEPDGMIVLLSHMAGAPKIVDPDPSRAELILWMLLITAYLLGVGNIAGWEKRLGRLEDAVFS